ncbi:O-antigen ligase family protein [Patescibacteria group bacterium]|nr:O-antigen ligase family protein [Patescibacteria group bacterium]MBU1931565.1 O-antigen ligase family protein [Patescibacteria group bacterium]
MLRLFSLITGLIWLTVNLGQLVRIPLTQSTIGLYLPDLLCLLLLLSWLLIVKPTWSQLKKRPLTKPILGFALIALLSLFLAGFTFSVKEIFIAGLYLGRWLVYAGTYWVFCWLFQKEKKFKQLWPKLMLGGIFLFALLGLVQYFIWPDLRPLKLLSWDDHYFRLASTFLDPNFAGIWLFFGLVLALEILPWVLPVFYLALALTYSRGSYLGFVLGILYLALAKKKLRIFVITILVLAPTLVLLPRPGGEGVKLERSKSTLARVSNWQESLELALKKPIFGYGFNTLRYVKDEPVSHAGAGVDSSLLFVLLTSGLFGLTAYLFLLVKLWLNGGLVLKTSLLAVLIHSFFNNTLFYAPVMFWLWTLAAWEEN